MGMYKNILGYATGLLVENVSPINFIEGSIGKIAIAKDLLSDVDIDELVYDILIDNDFELFELAIYCVEKSLLSEKFELEKFTRDFKEELARGVLECARPDLDMKIVKALEEIKEKLEDFVENL